MHLAVCLLMLPLHCATKSVVIRREKRNTALVTAGAKILVHTGGYKPDVLHKHFSWTASDFSSCKECANGYYKYRPVHCHDMFSDFRQNDRFCKGAKPHSFELCDCGLEVCEPASSDTKCPSNVDKVTRSYEELGCFQSSQISAISEQNSHFDMACKSLTGSAKCRYGLPFYSFIKNSTTENMTTKTCFDNCTSRGLDVFGILQSKACACGASKLNKVMWSKASTKRKQQLVFDSEVFSELEEWSPLDGSTDLTGCPLRLYRYSGPFDSGALPEELIGDLLISDQEYRDTIATGNETDEEAEEDGASADDDNENNSTSTNETKNETQDEVSEVAYQHCWPNSCGAGKPWSNRTSKNPSSALDSKNKWFEYVIINYVFTPGLKASRKDVFRRAAAEWENHTCVDFVERNATPDNPYYLRVGFYNNSWKGSCYVQGKGFPPFNTGYGWGPSIMHLGWCNNMAHLGNVMHELGHVLGLAHTQQRPDATKEFKGHGPYLKMYWDNAKLSQYKSKPNAYIGSGDDSNGSWVDPKVGYAPYDFGSIMHYGGGVHSDKPAFKTIPEDKADKVGNRKHLSQGDIDAVNDMYQCAVRTSEG